MASEAERTIHDLQRTIAELRARLEAMTSERDFLRRLLRESSVPARNELLLGGEEHIADFGWDESLLSDPDEARGE